MFPHPDKSTGTSDEWILFVLVYVSGAVRQTLLLSNTTTPLETLENLRESAILTWLNTLRINLSDFLLFFSSPLLLCSNLRPSEFRPRIKISVFKGSSFTVKHVQLLSSLFSDQIFLFFMRTLQTLLLRKKFRLPVLKYQGSVFVCVCGQIFFFLPLPFPSGGRKKADQAVKAKWSCPPVDDGRSACAVCTRNKNLFNVCVSKATKFFLKGLLFPPPAFSREKTCFIVVVTAANDDELTHGEGFQIATQLLFSFLPTHFESSRKNENSIGRAESSRSAVGRSEDVERRKERARTDFFLR